MALHPLLPALAAALVASTPPQDADGPRTAVPTPYFRITVHDAQTKRGVPLVELTTTNGIVHVTDSAGVIAFLEPGLMDTDVHFTVRSHGYRFPADGFDVRGVRLAPRAGESATIDIDRVNIAERLYRVTGQGIYRDSMLLGDATPIREPLLNGRVMGQDSVQTALYRGRIWWFFGDTARPEYPLGNFAMSGAVSALPPSRGGDGLAPGVGIDLTYLVDETGFSRPMCPIAGEPGPVWCDGMTTVRDADGRERLLCHFARMKDLGTMQEHGFALYDDATERFAPIARMPLDESLHMRGGGSPVTATHDGVDYIHFCVPLPLLRCRATPEALTDPSQYESFTCLEPGTRYDPMAPRIEARDGRAVWAWKRDTGFLSPTDERDLVAKGLLGDDETRMQLVDAHTGTPVLAHVATVAWNDHRKRWIAIVQEIWGTSLCGEIWFAESAELAGPWREATKVVSHDDYSFYNVAHHPFLDEDGGRLIHFQGTYTKEFSGTKAPTPRYDYNQVMYRLDLSDPRLSPQPRSP